MDNLSLTSEPTGPAAQIERELQELRAAQAVAKANREQILESKLDGTKSLVEKMLEQQADKDKAEAETRKQWIRYVIGPALLAVLGASGWSASNASNAAEAADQVNTRGAS